MKMTWQEWITMLLLTFPFWVLGLVEYLSPHPAILPSPPVLVDIAANPPQLWRFGSGKAEASSTTTPYLMVMEQDSFNSLLKEFESAR